VRRALFGTFLAAVVLISAPSTADAAVPWVWPVTGPIVRGYDPPDAPYGSGHRGIDIAAAVGTVVVAPDDGVVTFAGKVGGRLFLTIDHGGGVMSTCSWLTSVLVRKGDRVVRGEPVATTDWGHADLTTPHLHFGVRLDGEYVDPFAYIGFPSVSTMIRLAPLAGPAPLAATGRMTGLAYPTSPRLARVRGGRIGGYTRVRGGVVLAAVPRQCEPHGVRCPSPSASVRHRLERASRHR